MSALNIVNLSKRYGTLDVLKDINLNIQSGEFIVLVGPSDCGKSTLLSIIAGQCPRISPCRIGISRQGVCAAWDSPATQ
jgi:ABC-type Fe3+/spermidine/putrescine transport system ATPase subunit